MADPVTTADLTGKKICWDDGSIETYAAGGSFSTNTGGTGTWVVTDAGEIKTTTTSVSCTTKKLDNGTFSGTCAVNGENLPFAGHYCN